MSYTDLLKEKEWTEKCNEILQRDKYTCRDCGHKGFHNNTFMAFDNLSDVNELFGNTLFEGESFIDLESKFQKVDYIEQMEGVKSCFKNKVGGKNRYDFNFWGKLKQSWHSGFGTIPFGFRLVTEYSFEEIDIKMKCLKHFRAYLLEFPKRIAEKIYVTIESNMKGFSMYANRICISYDNKLMYLEHDYNEGLNIHHKYYIHGKRPWEYVETELITLCESCHKKRHEQPTPCYRSSILEQPLSYCYQCDKCLGSGYLPQYSHIENGICFKCGGEGVTGI